MNFNKQLPEKFLNLRLTEEQKLNLSEEQELQKFNFQVDNEEILPMGEF